MEGALFVGWDEVSVAEWAAPGEHAGCDVDQVPAGLVFGPMVEGTQWTEVAGEGRAAVLPRARVVELAAGRGDAAPRRPAGAVSSPDEPGLRGGGPAWSTTRNRHCASGWSAATWRAMSARTGPQPASSPGASDQPIRLASGTVSSTAPLLGGAATAVPSSRSSSVSTRNWSMPRA